MNSKSRPVPKTLLLTVFAIFIGIATYTPQAAAAVGPVAPCPPGGAGGANAPWTLTVHVPLPIVAGRLVPGATVDAMCAVSRPGAGPNNAIISAGVNTPVVTSNPPACPVVPASVGLIAPAGGISVNWGTDCGRPDPQVPFGDIVQVQVRDTAAGAGAVKGIPMVTWRFSCVVSAQCPQDPARPAGQGSFVLVAGSGNATCSGPGSTVDCGTLDIYYPAALPVGGMIVQADKLALVTPYIALASVIGTVTVLSTALYTRRVKRRKTDDD